MQTGRCKGIGGLVAPLAYEVVIWTYLVHLIAQIALIQAVDYVFNLSSGTWLGNHRPLVAFFLVVHFIGYFLTEVLSADRTRLDKLVQDKLGEPDE